MRRIAYITVAVATLTLGLASSASALDFTKSNTCDISVWNYPIKVTWRDEAGSRRPYNVTISKPLGAGKLTQLVADFVDGSTIIKRTTLNDQAGTDEFITGDFAHGLGRNASHVLVVKTKATVENGSTCTDTTSD